MSINVSSISLNTQNSNSALENVEKQKGTIFEEFYNAAIGLYTETNDMQVQAEKFQLEFAAGKTDDVAGLIIAQKKAETALQFTAQITNKVLESYKQILQIQI